MEHDLTIASRILVVDDEQAMREGCRRTLSAAGYRVDVAADEAGARERLAGAAYDLVLLDLEMPDGSGLELLDRLLACCPDAICIVMTGLVSVQGAVDAVRHGAYNLLSRPFTPDELLIAVGQGLEWQRLKAVERQAQELARAREELERLDRAKSQFMLIMAHELRAPVAAAKGYLNLIAEGFLPAEEIPPTLNRVQARLQEMLDLTVDLVELARLKQARGLAPKTGDQDLAAVLAEVHDLLAGQARAKGQDLRLEIVDRPIVVANRDHLKQVWTNLIANAIKYTPRGGQIVARLCVDHGLAVGVVEDTGMGIPEDELPHLFQEFYRSSGARASGEIGTGLGLSIVKQIVDSYGGQLSATSRVGQGTTLRFALPLGPAAD